MCTYENTLISVVMSVYNETEHELRKAIESILKQTYKNIEFIIVNDNPKEHKIAEIVMYYLKNDSRIKYLENEKNLGLALSLNVGIRQSIGSYIARMDADDISTYDRLEKEIKLILEQKLDLVSSNYDYINEKDEYIGIHKPIPVKEVAIKTLLPLASFICHPSVLMKREAIEAVGLYRYFCVSQDYDLWLRLLTSGYKIGTMNEVLLHYRTRDGSLSSKNSIKRVMTVYYQKKLYKQREKYSHDFYSIDDVYKLEQQSETYAKDKRISSIVYDTQDAIAQRKISKFFINYLKSIFFRYCILTSWINDLVKYTVLKKFFTIFGKKI